MHLSKWMISQHTFSFFLNITMSQENRCLVEIPMPPNYGSPLTNSWIKKKKSIKKNTLFLVSSRYILIIMSFFIICCFLEISQAPKSGFLCHSFQNFFSFIKMKTIFFFMFGPLAYLLYAISLEIINRGFE